ncbi:MAG: alpha-amylase family glycosyl hydrolase [Pseudomonadota bacterium]
MPDPVHHATEQRSPWWSGAIIYQIYPRSFYDRNGDGVGDLQGITEKLDYIARLGVDGVWLSPFFTSPMADFGYDVADYCDVDPVFGDLGDFDRLIEKAHALGLKVIIDQVYSHTSDRHPWFRESRTSCDNAKADWYVWADAKADGAPPNNWQSVFTGPAWTWDARRGQYYLHNFLTAQPDLNLHNSTVQDALLNVARFWLDRGVDGFRLDAINFAMHDPLLRDNPPAPILAGAPSPTRPFDFQDHRYNQSHEGIAGFLERLRATTDDYGEIFTVAEVVGPSPLAEMKSFTAGDKRLTAAYSFDFLYADQLTPALVKKAVSGWFNAKTSEKEGMPAWAFSNHDAPRVVSRWTGGADENIRARLFAMLLLSLNGVVFLYQGEELGLPQADLDFEDLKDPEAIANWPETLGRDGARTPMPWTNVRPNAGFGAAGLPGAAPWLPVPADHLPLSVETQEADEQSTLAFVKTLIGLRRDFTALRDGDLKILPSPDGILAILRDHQNARAFCVFNLGAENHAWRPEDISGCKVAAAVNAGPAGAEPPVALAPMTGYIAMSS